ncbi:MAG: hypothetical protein DIZ78_12300 [endosymbiont of Escarpia spicata]|uniref:Uncharacterized protein n=1 Tax=endosymbiont of Escarpia spicata TaxID=2200908 RepID=A0A370DHB3_9GAMM|nr:MAG: hypothetical protein DIZ78_12300 [endosymbiont of Escarpia spicata]
MEGLDYWHLCEAYSVIQTALLIVGADPAVNQEWVDDWEPDKRPEGYDAVRSALCHAVLSQRLPARTMYEEDLQFDPECEFDEIDWQRTTILLEDIRAWLRDQEFQPEFFFPTETDKPDYLDPLHPRYAPKLAAAINAWLALEDSTHTTGKSPKQALSKWLREHAADYKLSDEEGKPNETGIEECAKVANWQDKGGAPKTPGK